MNIARRQVGQFRQPLANKAAIRVAFLGLADRVEYAEVGRGIGAGRGAPLPASVVGSQITVNQVLHEPALAFAPVDQQVLGQEHGADHAQPVVHPAGGKQLTHGGIDQRNARAALFPGSQTLGVVAPAHRLGFRAKGAVS